MKRITSIAVVLLLSATVATANVTTPFEQATVQAQKIIKTEAITVTKASVEFKLLATYKGKLKNKRISFVISGHLKEVKSKDVCFLLLDADNKIYKTGFGCGEHSILITRKGKLHHGIYRYALNDKKRAKAEIDYSRNAPHFMEVEQLENGIKSHIKAVEKKAPSQ